MREPLPMLLTAAGLTLLALFMGQDRLASASVDIAHHLQLALTLRDYGGLPPDSAGYLAEMYGYPNAAHWMAALLMRAGVPPLSALATVSVGATLTLWTVLFLLARRVGVTAAAGGAVAILALVWLQVGVHGREVVQNFFYAQLAGEAAALLLVVAACRLTNRWAFATAAAAATFVAAYVHLLPAMKVAGLFMTLFTVGIGREVLLHRRRPHLADVAGLAATPAALLANPTFAHMIRIAVNDGGIDLGFRMGPPAIVGLAALLAAICLFGLWRLNLAGGNSGGSPAEDEAGPAGDTGPRRRSLLFAWGLAAAGAALAQYLAWRLLGRASEYAVLKHGFGVISLLALCLPGALQLALASRAKGGERPRSRIAVPTAGAVAALTASGLLLRPNLVDPDHIDGLIAEARQLKVANRLANTTPVFFAAEQEPPLVNYMLSVAALRAPRDANALSLLTTGRPADLRSAQYIVAPVGDPALKRKGCERGKPAPQLVLASGPCLTGEWGPPPILFRVGGDGVPYLAEGWSTPEAGGVWSQARDLSLVLPTPRELAQAGAARLELVLFGFIPPESPRRTVSAAFAGHERWETVRFDLKEVNERVLKLSIPDDLRGADQLEVRLRVHDPVTPRALGLGADERLLGVGLAQARFVFGSGS